MAGRIRREDIAAVREKARIEEVVGEYVSLRSAGVGSMKGLCPFHDERTPSFHVRPQLGLWHCFGCDEGGDVISFVQKIDHLTFTEAVERLAARTAVVLRYEDDGGPSRPREEPGRRQRLVEAHRVAAAYFSEQLATPEAEPARSFLAARGFDRAAAVTFGVGYAPKGWDHLLRHLRGRSFTEAELAASGLVSQGNRGHYDRFRGRLMWPIRDITGDVIGFGARHLYEDDPGPKYLNTPETPIYRKSQVLYGIDVAKREIAKERQVVVVEGYTDVMAAHLAGVGTAIATCGTAFGADHVRIVRRLLGDSADSSAGVMLSTGRAVGGEVIFTFDGDEAGQKAALRAFSEDQQFASQTFVAVSPDGLDPCDLRLQRGDAAVRALVSEREPLFEFAIRSVLARVDLNTSEGRVAGLRVAAPVVARIRDRALRGDYARKLGGWLGMDDVEVRRAVASAPRQAAPLAGGREEGQVGQGSSGRGGGRSQGDDGAGRQERRTAVSYPDDPVARLERQVLEVALQLPREADAAGFDNLDAGAFQVPAYRAVHDAIRAAGGTAAFEALRDQQRAAGAADVDRSAAAAWSESVLEGAAGLLTPLVTELAVTPLPADHQEAMGRWARGVVRALLRRGVIRRIGDVKARLQRLEPESEEHKAAFAELLVIEQERQTLSDEG